MSHTVIDELMAGKANSPVERSPTPESYEDSDAATETYSPEKKVYYVGPAQDPDRYLDELSAVESNVSADDDDQVVQVVSKVEQVDVPKIESFSVKELQLQLKNVLSDAVLKKMAEEDIDGAVFLYMLKESADSPIYQRLGISYGKAFNLKKTYSPVAKKTKPTSKELKEFTPKTKSLYTNKRKLVGVRATNYWSGNVPNFTTPAKKLELQQFAESVVDECGFERVGFGVNGIMDHTRSVFTERRRNTKKQTNSSSTTITTKTPSDSSKSQSAFQPKVKKIKTPSPNANSLLTSKYTPQSTQFQVLQTPSPSPNSQSLLTSTQDTPQFQVSQCSSKVTTKKKIKEKVTPLVIKRKKKDEVVVKNANENLSLESMERKDLELAVARHYRITPAQIKRKTTESLKNLILKYNNKKKQ